MKYDEGGIQSLVQEIKTAPLDTLQPLLLKLMSQPLTFELAIAASPVAANYLRKAFTLEPRVIPSKSNGFYSKALSQVAAAPLLPQIVTSLNRDESSDLTQRHWRVSACFNALADLKDASFIVGVDLQNRSRSGITKLSSNHNNMANRRVAHDDNGDGGLSPLSVTSSPEFTQETTFKPNQRQAQKANSRLNLDALPFNVLGIRVPENATEAEATTWQIRDFLEENIEAALRVLQRPACIESLKAALLAAPSPSGHTQISTTASLTAPLGQKPKIHKIDTQLSVAPAQSVKGALSLERVKELGPWGIHLSSRAERDLRQARNGDQSTFRIILKKIKQLSYGHFSNDNQKKLTGRDVPIPIYEAKMSRDSRLVYRIDCVADYESEDEQQVLVIYGVYTHSQLERGQFWNSVGRQIGRRGREYHKRCTARGEPVDYKGDKVFHPRSFPAMSEADALSNASDPNDLTIPQHDLSELHELLVLQKFTPLSKPLLYSMFANIDVTHPFNPSPFEKKIIEHPESCYVIGRSGTGKTTTLLFRLLAREHVYKAMNDHDPDSIRRPRQLFVTQSRVLAGKVEEYYRKLHDSMDIADWTLETLRTPANVTDAQSIRVRHTKRVEDLLHDDDEQNYRADLPKQFSELKDEHFPLFLTMEKLCEMIEADLDAEAGNNATLAAPKAGRTTKRKFMTYTTWLSEYWPHFAEYLTKGLDAALVYSEIMGVIKGSEESLQHAEHHLSLVAYENFSSRRQSTFVDQRTRIFEIFASFQRKKRMTGHIDAADRTHAILARLQLDIRIIGQPIDYLYVDEAQDNLLIDALMLRIICCNPNGLFWAGDTAQTISVGSSFKFNDLRACIYRVDNKRAAENATAVIAREPPALFELVVNYRSHDGIVNCARSIINLIKTFWPDSIDNLAEERGVVDGDKPVFFTGWDESSARYDQFLFGSNDSQIEFGARQAIIVRNEESKQRLRAEVGREIGVVFSVFEAKGLEFDDVLIIDFFNDSAATEGQWSVVVNAIPQEERGCHAPWFDPIRHATVCAELKSLYVAITRARNNIWIADRSNKGEPMRRVWSAGNQIQNCAPGTKVLAVRSSEDEWNSQAHRLFKHKRFSQAAHCFEQAGQPHQAAVATAYYLRQIAEEKPLSQVTKLQESRAAAYLAAGAAFETSALPQDWGFGARARAEYFRIAGQCLQEVGKEQYARAAVCFERAGDYMSAAKLYREAVQSNFDDAVRLIRDHNLEHQHEDARSIIRAAKLHYFKRAIPKEVEKGRQLFDNTEKALEYLDERGLDVAQTEVLRRMKRWEEAGELHLQEGRTLMAADAFLEADAPETRLRAREVAVNALSEQIAFGKVPILADPGVQHIRRLLGKLKVLGLADDIADEIDFFDIVVERDVQRLRDVITARIANTDDLQRDFGGGNEDSKLLLALDLFFDINPWGQPLLQLSTPEMIVRLQWTLTLVRILRARSGDKGSVSNPVIQKLFGFREYAERQYLVWPGTYLHRTIDKLSQIPQTRLEEGILVEADALQEHYRRELRAEIKTRVKDMATIWTDRGQRDVACLQHLFFGCTNKDCPRSHITEADCTAHAYTQRVKAHLLALNILSAVDGLVERSDIVWQERIWSARLYETLRPATSVLGSPSMLNLPEMAHPISQSWIRPQLYSLYKSHAWCLTTAARCAYLSCAYNPDAREAGGILANAPLLKAGNALRMNEGVNGPPALAYLFSAIQAPTNDRHCFLQGVEFLSMVLQKEELFEVVLFVDLFEELVTNIFIARSKDSGSVLAPKSWCLAALRKRPSARVYSLNHLMKLIDVGGKYLLQLIESWRGSGLYLQEHRRLIRDGALPPLVRAVLIARMCNAMCIIGCNVNLPVVQGQVYAALQVIQRQHSGAGRALYERYQRAKDWPDLKTLTQNSLTDSKTDCMVQFSRHQFHVVPATRKERGVFLVYFRTHEELIEKLRGLRNGQAMPEAARKPATAPRYVSRVTPVALKSIPAGSNFTPVAEADDTITVDQPQELASAATRAASEGTSPGANEPDNEEEDPVDEPPEAARDGPMYQDKARLIQTWFRRQCKGRHIQAGSSGVRSYYIAFREASATQAVGTGFYRKLMFGPLPHLMLALQRAETKIGIVRRELKKQLLAANEELETLDVQLNSTSQAAKALKSLRNKLQPDAIVHITRDVYQLKRLVLECEKQLHGLPQDVPGFELDEIEDEIHTARRGIVDQPQPFRRRPVKLPTLAADDGYDYL